MSVSPNNVEFYGSANMPTGDGTSTGGAVSFSTLVIFSDISPAGLLDYVSSSASDTAATLTVSGRDSTGVIQVETKTLSGTAKVSGSQSFERLLRGQAGGTTAVGDIAAISHTLVISGTAQSGANTSGITGPYIQLQSGQGASVAVNQIVRPENNSPAGVQNQLRRIISVSGDFAYVNRDWGTAPTNATIYSVYEGMLFDLSPNQITLVTRPFYNAAADVPGGSNKTYYEKIFAVNNNTTTALTSGYISKTVDPSVGTLEFALTNALNDTAAVANRQTAPASGITAFTTGVAPQTINIPSPQNLPSGAAPNAAGAQGIWLSLLLVSGSSPAKTSFTMQGAGQTT